jgi:hypothetical protein
VIEEGSFGELLERTVGAERRVRFTLASSAPGSVPEGFDRLEDGRLELGVESVTQELEHSLRRLREAGCEVADLEIEVPSLQQVFLHLTGKELRE